MLTWNRKRKQNLNLSFSPRKNPKIEDTQSAPEKPTINDSNKAVAPCVSHLHQLLTQIKNILQESFIEAKRQGKMLLVVAGEEHSSSNSLLLLAMLLKHAKKIGVSDFYIEFPKVPGFKKIELKETEHNPSLYNVSNIIVSVPYAKKLGFNCIPIDIANDQNSPDHLQLTTRDPAMIKSVIDYNKPGIVLVGALHLQSFCQSETLKEKYHVIGLNITGVSNSKELHFNGNSDAVKTEQLSKLEKFAPKVYESLMFSFISDKIKKFNLIGNIQDFNQEDILSIVDNIYEDQSISDIGDLSQEDFSLYYQEAYRKAANNIPDNFDTARKRKNHLGLSV